MTDYVMVVVRLGDRLVVYTARVENDNVVIDYESFAELIYMLAAHECRATLLRCHGNACTEDGRFEKLREKPV